MNTPNQINPLETVGRKIGKNFSFISKNDVKSQLEGIQLNLTKK